jgi:hypothetical protein
MFLGKLEHVYVRIVLQFWGRLNFLGLVRFAFTSKTQHYTRAGAFGMPP